MNAEFGEVGGKADKGANAELAAELARQHTQQQLLLQQQQQAYVASLGAQGFAGLNEGQVLVAGMGGMDRSMYNSVLRAFLALEANAVESDHMLSQVRESRDVCCMLYCVYTIQHTIVLLCIVHVACPSIECGSIASTHVWGSACPPFSCRIPVLPVFVAWHFVA